MENSTPLNFKATLIDIDGSMRVAVQKLEDQLKALPAVENSLSGAIKRLTLEDAEEIAKWYRERRGW